MWPVDAALSDGSLSARGLDRVLRVAWTIADLGGRSTPENYDVTEALGLWKGSAD
jgi:magnesium chelatase family protein